MLRLKGLECLVSILKCMVEWSHAYYIDPATTGLNTVRVIRATEKGEAPEKLDLNKPDLESSEEKGAGWHGNAATGKSGTGTAIEGVHSSNDMFLFSL